jgi:hypothetical protein
VDTTTPRNLTLTAGALDAHSLRLEPFSITRLIVAAGR